MMASRGPPASQVALLLQSWFWEFASVPDHPLSQKFISCVYTMCQTLRIQILVPAFKESQKPEKKYVEKRNNGGIRVTTNFYRGMERIKVNAGG